jgi:membrane protease YdiL (CAAX protease family)
VSDVSDGTDGKRDGRATPRGAALEVAVVALLGVVSVTAKAAFGVEASVWTGAIDLAWQLPLAVVLVRVARARGETLAALSAPLTRAAVWDIALLFVAAVAVYAATYRLLGAAAPALVESAWSASPRITREPGALPALALAVAGPILGELVLRGHLQTRLRQLRAPAVVVVVASAGLQAALSLDRGPLVAAAFFAQLLVFAAYYHRTRRLWPVVIAHAMQGGIGLAALARNVF